jgi:hypothetical protein
MIFTEAMRSGEADSTAALQFYINACIAGGTRATDNYHVVLPTGTFICTSGFPVIPPCRGIVFRGAGIGATIIRNLVSSTVLGCRGISYSYFSDLTLEGIPGAAIMDFNTQEGDNGIQQNKIERIFFEGGDYGVKVVPHNGNLGSEFSYRDCYWHEQLKAGIYLDANNALQHNVFGGNVNGCEIGFHVYRGQMNVFGTSFQRQANADIMINNSANDISSIQGCRTESKNFLKTRNFPHVDVSAITHLNSAEGMVLDMQGPFCARAIVSRNGFVTQHAAYPGEVVNSSFGLTNWIRGNHSGARVRVRGVQIGKLPNDSGGTATFLERGTYAGNSWVSDV